MASSIKLVALALIFILAWPLAAAALQAEPPAFHAPPKVAPAEMKNPADEASRDWRDELSHFQIRATGVGYMPAGPFLRFLDRAESNGPQQGASGYRMFLIDPAAFVRQSGLLPTMLLVLLGGLALNFTPCVLPMIPINLAILGAGAQCGSRMRGFALGTAYGAGIALVYGLLGASVVVTGSHFGAIQSNPWFNLAIALIFGVLTLAMFDVGRIDFSTFQAKLNRPSQPRGGFSTAFTMGAVVALLAGACVAPVVIAVLLLASGLGAAGVLLPFVLGLGMALPWPFAGAGLSMLPKPGKWMIYVKCSFGAAILYLALHHGHLAYRTLRPAVTAQAEAAQELHIVDGASNANLAKALRQARLEARPVFIDFQAAWCKNCRMMEAVTFRSAPVQARLKQYAFIRYLTDNQQAPATRAVLEHFAVKGLPTFVVLELKRSKPAGDGEGSAARSFPAARGGVRSGNKP